MTNEELKAVFVSAFTELHAKVDALPEGHNRTVAQRLLLVFHKSGENFADHCADLGEIVPLDGTGKPPGP